MKYMTKIKNIMKDANICTFWKSYYLLNGRDGRFSPIEKSNLIKIFNHLLGGEKFPAGSYIQSYWEDEFTFVLWVMSPDGEVLKDVKLFPGEGNDSPVLRKNWDQYGGHWAPIKTVLESPRLRVLYSEGCQELCIVPDSIPYNYEKGRLVTL